MDKHIRQFSAETKALEDSRSLIVTISTPTPDRSGDVVVPKGAKLDHFLKNPVVLFGHKYSEPPIAKAEEIVVTEDGIKAKVTFPSEGVYAFADTIYQLIKEGVMNAWSIGFQADPDQTEPLPGGGVKFNSWEMLEFSAVPVPANPEALTILRSKGISEDAIKEVTEQKPVEAPTPDEPQPQEPTAEQIEHDAEAKTLTITVNDGEKVTYQLTDAASKALSEAIVTNEPLVDDAVELVKALSVMREQLKPADKHIGLALRTLKTLLDQPNQ